MRGLLLCLLACAEEKGGGAAPAGDDTAVEEAVWAWDDTKTWRENCAPPAVCKSRTLSGAPSW